MTGSYRVVRLLGAVELVAFRELEEHAFEIAVAVVLRDVVGRAVGDDASVREEHDPVAHALDFAHVVARDEERAAVLLAQLRETGAHACRDVGVERRGRLVEGEQTGSVQGRAHDSDEGALTRRELGSHRAREVRDPEPLETRVVPIQTTEFVCKNCFLVKHRSQLKDKKKMLCRDCA